ncbi:DNA mismatch repair protein Msh6 isoform X2 [Zootermopsis nevadensis]|uniref:DNA mismatch repair protein Msh6 isoform X2 n=1 Tax=Zootermopsis nevadensis TaxID=136037 RepID=UPI000B8E2B71|nr:DNA mismatch repair protein Msh6 isoform X2 [Zootermopsis nevadensis]
MVPMILPAIGREYCNCVQNGGSLQTNDNFLGKAGAATPSSASKKGTKKTPAKKGSKKIVETATSVTHGKEQNKGKEFGVYDIVWSKLDGYPWWPSLVCNHPRLKTHVKENDIHVQFFDDPPTRAWIHKKYVEMYLDGMKKLAPIKDKDKWRTACNQADSALKLSNLERSELIVDYPDDSASDTECEDEEEAEGVNKKDQEVAQEDPSPPLKKRRILVLDSEDSEDEYKPKKEELDVLSESASSGIESDEVSGIESVEGSEEGTPVKVNKRKRSSCSKSSKKSKSVDLNSTPSNEVSKETRAKLAVFPSEENSAVKRNDLEIFSSPSQTVKDGTKVKLALFSSKENTEAKQAETVSSEPWPHLKLDFLKPNKIRDAKRRTPADPDYDPKTLFVPEEFKRNLTPALRQWWEMKSQHFDCILFFKLGKFYELYHMDAVTGVNELGLQYMKGDNAHSGFPEIAYGRFSSSLIEKGYKVARVEQTETPDMMGERCKGMAKVSKFDKVVKREICQITAKGTRVFSVIDGGVSDAENNYLLALTEKYTGDCISYGICFIDTSIGVFHLGQFVDDRHSSRLRTLFAHHPPVQVLYEKRALSEKTLQLLNSSLASVLKESLASETEFWNSHKTLTTLAEGGYFSSESSGVKWPETLKQFLNEADTLGLTAHDEYELAVRALGACAWYLKESYLDQQLLSMGRFELYQPQDLAGTKEPAATVVPIPSFSRHMVLDGITLHNLSILEDHSGENDGTLLQKLDLCCTPFGKRLLRHWLCSPLCDIAGITARQEAITWLLKNPSLISEARDMLSQLPDLERLLSKIHTQGNALRSKSHPDSRAIFFEDRIYSKRKILDFISTLAGFKSAEKIVSLFQDEHVTLSSKLLVQCTSNKQQNPAGSFPNLTEALHFFETAFDHEEAKESGRINPSKGVDPEYDSVVEELQELKTDLDEYLNSQKKYFGCKVTYCGSDKKRFQLEVPDSFTKKAGKGYELQGQRKGFKKYWTSETKNLLSRQIAAEEHEKNVLKDLNRRIFARFSSDYEIWNAAVQCLSVLDVLLSLAEYARSEGGETCIPEFVISSGEMKPFLKITDGRHPCVSSIDGFIPNDTVIGCGEDEASLVLVTGPNMGGKSTLMRQVGLLVVMAHMGCHVPAAVCQLSPVDRVFTRLGANDNIMAGESTFYVELSETAAVLHHATKHSLVLVDELGRGTSTYDGTAIAASVVQELGNLGCRTLFSTHYHTLVEDFRHSLNITLGHMACMVENENEEDLSEETVTFLYKFASGACPKSYGFNAARLAGIPSGIIHTGYNKAVQLEKEGDKRKLFQHLFGKKQKPLDIASLIEQVRITL